MLCSENKIKALISDQLCGDQLCGNHAADLHLSYRICKSRLSQDAAHMLSL